MKESYEMLMKVRLFEDVSFTESECLIIQDSVCRYLKIVKKDFEESKELEDLEFLNSLIIKTENLLEKIK